MAGSFSSSPISRPRRSRVQHQCRTKFPQYGKDGLDPLLAQPQRGLELFFALLLPCGVVAEVGLAGVQQLRQRLPYQAALPLQVAAGDQFLVGMVAQPSRAEAQQLVNLIIAHPIVLVVVQNRQQHVQVSEEIPGVGRRL